MVVAGGRDETRVRWAPDGAQCWGGQRISGLPGLLDRRGNPRFEMAGAPLEKRAALRNPAARLPGFKTIAASPERP